MCKRGLELILSLHASCAYATLVFLRNDLNWITICEEALRALRPGESEVKVSEPAFGFTICVAT